MLCSTDKCGALAKELKGQAPKLTEALWKMLLPLKSRTRDRGHSIFFFLSWLFQKQNTRKLNKIDCSPQAQTWVSFCSPPLENENSGEVFSLQDKKASERQNPMRSCNAFLLLQRATSPRADSPSPVAGCSQRWVCGACKPCWSRLLWVARSVSQQQSYEPLFPL